MSVQRFVFSSPGATAGPEEGRRFAQWLDEYRANVVGCDVHIDQTMPFATRAESLATEAATLSRAYGSVTQVVRQRKHLARDGDDRINLVINCGTATSEGRIASSCLPIAPGSAILYDLTKLPIADIYPPCHRLIAIKLPRRLLRAAMAATEDLSGIVIPAGNEALRLLRYYANALLDDGGFSEPAVLAHAGQSVLDLAVLAIGTDRDNTQTARQRGLRAARLAAVLRLIRAEYTDPGISPAAIAARIGISTRYLHDLLQETGVSFSERVIDLRLAKTFALLCRERGKVLKVSDAAYAAGFNDLSHFHRLFRRKYGLTPGAARGSSAAD
jgi:AraC-like DNA-binding protein